MSIDIEHVSFSYGKHQVLRDVNASIPDGVLVNVLGPNGVGKSTLFRCILCLNSDYEGVIRVNGKDLRDLSVRERAREISYIPQTHAPVYNYKVRDVVLMSTGADVGIFGTPGREQVERAEQALERIGIGHLADRMYTHISGGEQQLVLIARALAQNAKTIVMDEPTSALDPKTTRQILELIGDINKKLGITVVIITHQMSVVKEVCNHVAILDDGEVAEEGLVAAVFAAPKSPAGRRLVFPGGVDEMVSDPKAERRVRLIFRDSQTTAIPLVARLASEENIFCNVISASTQKLSETVYGSMMLGIPSAQFDKAVAFIHNVANVQVEEVDSHVQ